MGRDKKRIKDLVAKLDRREKESKSLYERLDKQVTHVTLPTFVIEKNIEILHDVGEDFIGIQDYVKAVVIDALATCTHMRKGIDLKIKSKMEDKLGKPCSIAVTEIVRPLNTFWIHSDSIIQLKVKGLRIIICAH